MITLALLTFNRLDFVKKVVLHNYENASCKIDEVVWCDNGSTDGTVEYMESLGIVDKKILNKENKGIAKGYNAIYKLAKGDLIARPSTDMLMPKDWLKNMSKWHTRISSTGIVAMISESYKSVIYKRYLGEPIVVNGYKIQPANALGSIVFKKEIIDKDILLPDYGKYGYDDTIWTEKVRQSGYLNYYIDGVVQDFPEEEKYPEYVKWKREQIKELEKEHPELLELNKNING